MQHLGERAARHREADVHAAQLGEWRKQFIAAASADKARHAKATKEGKRIRELERELRRKDKALAEVTALLALKKKLEMLWGDEGADTSTKSET